MQLRKYILGELLFLANSNPPWWRTEFYQIKDKILQLYASWDGLHLQHIVKWCHDCEGSGKRTVEMMVLGQLERWQAGSCRRCDGSGIYSQFWVSLDSYKLGRRHFHRPIRKYYFDERFSDIHFDQHIEGYIEHTAPKYYLAREAAFWLALIFDRDLFFRKIGRAGFPSRKFTPMVILSTWIFNFKHWRARVNNDWREWYDFSEGAPF